MENYLKTNMQRIVHFSKKKKRAEEPRQQKICILKIDQRQSPPVIQSKITEFVWYFQAPLVSAYALRRHLDLYLLCFSF